VRGSDDLGPGNELKFTVFGTPGAKVEVQIAGTRGIFFLPEVRPGEYAGLYTIRRDDRIAPDATRDRDHPRRTAAIDRATLGQPLLAGGRPRARPQVERPAAASATSVRRDSQRWRATAPIAPPWKR
jgi:hypothetical protein